MNSKSAARSLAAAVLIATVAIFGTTCARADSSAVSHASKPAESAVHTKASVSDIDPISTGSAESLPDLSELGPAAPLARQEAINVILGLLNSVPGW